MDLVLNKKAVFDYEIVETHEVGIVLCGTEVKSLRHKLGNLKGSWVNTIDGELFLLNMHISPYSYSKNNHPPIQNRKLLMHKKEIVRLGQKQREKNCTLVITKIFTKGNMIKAELALAKGRKRYEKKQVLKDRDVKRETQKQIKAFK